LILKKKRGIGIAVLLVIIILAVVIFNILKKDEPKKMEETASDVQEETNYLEVENVGDYVILGDYKGIEIEKNVYVLSEDAVNHYIQTKIDTYNKETGENVSEIDDEWVREHTDYDTAEAFREGLKNQLQKTYDAKSNSELEEAVFQKVQENSQITEYPEGLLEEKKQYFLEQIENSIKESGQTREEFLDATGYSEDELNKECEKFAKSELGKELVMQALMEKENYKIGDEGYHEYMQDLTELLKYEDTAQLFKTYGEREIEEIISWNRITDMLIEYAVITEKEVPVDE